MTSHQYGTVRDQELMLFGSVCGTEIDRSANQNGMTKGRVNESDCGAITRKVVDINSASFLASDDRAMNPTWKCVVKNEHQALRLASGPTPDVERDCSRPRRAIDPWSPVRTDFEVRPAPYSTLVTLRDGRGVINSTTLTRPFPNLFHAGRVELFHEFCQKKKN